MSDLGGVCPKIALHPLAGHDPVKVEFLKQGQIGHSSPMETNYY